MAAFLTTDGTDRHGYGKAENTALVDRFFSVNNRVIGARSLSIDG
jgi:hypothetical protein